jgi:hypothetical protein
MQKLTKAVLKVMEEVKGIDKSMVVGTGQASYKGVPDQEVKKIIGQAMQKNGLAMIPIDIEPKTEISNWEEEWNGQKKRKQSIFTQVKVKYLLVHESGESIELCGYGHGVDSQDKGAGKATTYALKYALLYAFMVPTGKIDDADNTHSNDIEIPAPKKPKTTNNAIVQKVKIGDERFANAIQSIKDGGFTIEALKMTFDLTEIQLKELNDLEVINKKSKEVKDADSE